MWYISQPGEVSNSFQSIQINMFVYNVFAYDSFMYSCMSTHILRVPREDDMVISYYRFDVTCHFHILFLHSTISIGFSTLASSRSFSTTIVSSQASKQKRNTLRFTSCSPTLASTMLLLKSSWFMRPSSFPGHGVVLRWCIKRKASR